MNTIKRNSGIAIVLCLISIGIAVYKPTLITIVSAFIALLGIALAVQAVRMESSEPREHR